MFANRLQDLQSMAQSVTDAIEAACLQWKTSSLQCMSAGTSDDVKLQLSVRSQERLLCFEEVACMKVLGVSIDKAGSTQCSVEHSLQAAEGTYWRHARALQGRASLSTRLHAFASAPGATAVFGCSTWHVSKSPLQGILRLEYKWLRRCLRMRLRPDEGEMLFNVRTARCIDIWHAKLNIKRLHQFILFRLHAAAWRETAISTDDGSSPLAWLREDRSHEWWTAIQALGLHQRRRNGFVQRKSGHVTSWEDVFVCVYGVNWRARRNCFASAAEWKRDARNFVHKICELWDLPNITLTDHGNSDIAFAFEVKDSLPSELESMPWPDVHTQDVIWEHPSKRFECVVDCQALAYILNGCQCLTDKTCRPIFIRMARAIATLYDCGWKSRCDSKDPVCWRSREWNVAADYLCNYTVGKHTSWSDVNEDALASMRGQEYNLQLHSDGGLRKDTGASAAWTLMVWEWLAEEKTWQRKMVARAGVCIAFKCNSFIAECIGLEAGLSFLCELIQRAI